MLSRKVLGLVAIFIAVMIFFVYFIGDKGISYFIVLVVVVGCYSNYWFIQQYRKRGYWYYSEKNIAAKMFSIILDIILLCIVYVDLGILWAVLVLVCYMLEIYMDSYVERKAKEQEREDE